MRTREHIRELCSWPHRGTTSNYETLAADYARRALEEQDYHVEVKRFKAPDSALYRTYMLITAWAALACLLSVKGWPAAVAVALLPFIYLFAEFYLGWPLHKLFFPGGYSQNVIGHMPHPEAKGRVVLTAHLDTQLGSYLYSRGWVRILPLLFNLAVLGAVAALVLSLLRLIGISGLTILIIVLADSGLMLLLFIFFAAAEWKGKYVRGANDDASGCGVILALAEDLRKVAPRNLEVWVVATGAEESGLCGISNFIRKGPGKDFDKDSTWFINFDNLGGGDLVYLKGETIPGFSYPGNLAELARQVSEDPNSPDARPGWWAMPTDALAPALKGYPSITIFGYDEKGRTPNYHYFTDTIDNVDFDLPEKARTFAIDLVRKLDHHLSGQ